MFSPVVRSPSSDLSSPAAAQQAHKVHKDRKRRRLNDDDEDAELQEDGGGAPAELSSDEATASPPVSLSSPPQQQQTDTSAASSSQTLAMVSSPLSSASDVSKQDIGAKSTSGLLNESEVDCPLCLKMLAEPVAVPCGHSFCRFCLERALQEKAQCPMCRENLSFLNLRNLRPCTLLTQFIQLAFPEQYALRLNEVKQDREDYLENQVVRKIFVIGNEYRMIGQRIPGVRMQNIHQWTLFVRMEDDREDITNYIEKVQFLIHPSFRDHNIVQDKPPFTITRIGWGYFDAKIILHFQKKFNKPSQTIVHQLCFSGNGDFQLIETEFAKKLCPALQPGSRPYSSSAAAAASSAPAAGQAPAGSQAAAAAQVANRPQQVPVEVIELDDDDDDEDMEQVQHQQQQQQQQPASQNLHHDFGQIDLGDAFDEGEDGEFIGFDDDEDDGEEEENEDEEDVEPAQQHAAVASLVPATMDEENDDIQLVGTGSDSIRTRSQASYVRPPARVQMIDLMDNSDSDDSDDDEDDDS